MALSLHTRDVDRARDEISQLFCAHELHPTSRGVEVRLRAVGSGPVSVIGLDHGHLVRISPGQLDDFFLVQLPRAGRAQITHRGEQLLSTPQVAAVLSPGDPLQMVWGEHNPQLMCRLDAAAVDAQLALLTGETDLEPLRFQTAMGVQRAEVQRWLAGLQRLWSGLTREEDRLDAAEQLRLQQALITELLLTQPHNHTQLVRRGGGTAATVYRATCFLEARLSEPLEAPQIAGRLGIGVRQLQKAFRAELDTTPMTWLRHRRLQQAHTQLLRADPGSTTVTSVATGLGITHLGRFSADYRAQFGESPSVTLARPARADAGRIAPDRIEVVRPDAQD